MGYRLERCRSMRVFHLGVCLVATTFEGKQRMTKQKGAAPSNNIGAVVVSVVLLRLLLQLSAFLVVLRSTEMADKNLGRSSKQKQKQARRK